MNMKKLVAGVLTCCIVGGVMPNAVNFADNTVITASAEDYKEGTYEHLTYNKYRDHIEISGTYKLKTNNVVIPAEIEDLPVTIIGYEAFRDCTGLTSVTIPDSVASIGQSAFSGCTGLTSIEIPNSVTSIGRIAFYNCSGLTSVTIPDSVTSIGSWAFLNCKGLSSVTIPNSVTSIGSSAFSGTPWLKEKQKKNPLVIVNNILIDGETCSGDVVIPNSVTSIGAYAFSSCKSLTSVTISDGVTSIGEKAFSNCKGLTSVTISDSVKSIEYGAFLDTPWFEEKQKKNPLVIVNNILIDGTACSGDVVIPNSVTSIENFAFSCCKNLESVEIPDSVTSIGKSSFSLCYNLKSIKIPDSVTNIGEMAFLSCTSLTSIEIPDSVTSIENNAFTFCESLTSVTIPDSVISIGNGAFLNCTGLTSIEIPDSVTSIGNIVFRGCKVLTSINVSENNKNYSSADDVLFNKDKTELIQYPIEKTGTKYVIPDSVTSIGNFAFENCTGLTSIEIPDSVTSIGNSAFSCCTGLTSIEIPYSVTSIEKGAFSYCKGLTSVEIPDGVTSIGERAFSECAGLTSVTILNPECEIYNSENVISDTATIYGYENSTAQAYAEKYGRKFDTIDNAPETTTDGGQTGKTLLGDANCDGKVNVADATAIIQHIGNQDEYGLSVQGLENAELCDNKEGLTGMDAIAIQKLIANQIEKLPDTSSKN